MPYRLILASKSPRRQQLMRELGFDFEVRTKEVNEDFPEEVPPQKVAEYLAVKKSQAYSPIPKNELLVTADTVVIVNGTILGKPADTDEATEMLQALSGKSHQVVSGVCLTTSEKRISFSQLTEVTFRDLTAEEIEHYIRVYRPFDKAGAYGIQEWIGMIGIEQVRGDYYNVVGLPLERLYRNLLAFQ